MLSLICCAAVFAAPVAQAEPVTFEFLRMAGPAPDRKEAYDADKQVYHLHVRDIARFRVKAVADDLEKKPVVLRIIGMIEKPEGPLTLTSGKDFKLHHDGYDKELFKIERKEGVTTIEFLPKGKALLKPGASFQYIDFYR